MLKKNKDKNNREFTPNDLEQLTKENDKRYARTTARRSAKELSKTKKWQRRAFWALIAMLLILFIMYLISMLLTQWGDLVISVNGDAQGKGIVISEHSDLSDAMIQIAAPNVKDVTNITYNWLPLDELDNKEGSYNGQNHLAYTFFVGNNGSETVDYEGVLNITGASKGMDEAVRVMVYKNGEPFIYAKAKRGTNVAEEDTIAFINDKVIMKTGNVQIKPKQIDKYTIVSWVEGNDSECVDDIMGGYMRMSMLFSIADEEE